MLNVPIVLLPGTIWSFQALTIESSICNKLKHQKFDYFFLRMKVKAGVESLNLCKLQ